MFHNTKIRMIESDARFFSPWPTWSTLHTEYKTQERKTRKPPPVLAGTSDRPRRYCLQWFRTETLRCACKWPLGATGQHCPVTAKGQHYERTTLSFGYPALFRRSQKRTFDLWSHDWWEMVTDTHPATSQCSHWWWEMVPAPIQILTPIHRFIDQSICHGWYLRLMLIHLRRENTVNIDDWRQSTCGELRSIVDRRWISR